MKINRMTKRIFYAAFAFMLCVATGFFGRTYSFVRAEMADGVRAAYENTNVWDNLQGATVGGKSFDVADYPHDDHGKPQIVSFVEFCYSYYGDKQENYGLYIYVYNPQDIAFDTSGKNTVQFTYGNANDYDKYPLRFLNYSTELGYEGRFYKFGVDLTDAQKQEILKTVDPNSRVYQVSGFELSYKSKLTDYVCAQKYTYSGFAKGYGSELAESDSLSCKVDGFNRYLTLDVRSTVWRSQSSAKGKDYSNQLNSVYFSVPDKYFAEYGNLQEITAEWYEYQTDWVTVTTDMTLYSYMRKNMGRKYWSAQENGEKQYHSDESAPFGLFGWDCTTPTSSSSSHNGRYKYGYRLDTMNSNASSWVENPSQAFHYAFFTDQPITDAKVSKQTLSDWIYTYKDKYTVNRFLDCKDGNTVPAELFSDTVDDGRTMGYNRVVLSANDSFGLLSYNENHGFWNKVNDFGFWNTLLGRVPDDGSILVDQPIMPLKKAEYGDMEKTAYSSAFYIDGDDVDEFDDYIHKAWRKEETPVLFRFAVTDYYRAYGNALTRTGDSSESFKKTLYGAKETVFLDFDIIQLMFRKDNVDTVIPVVSSPTDVIGGISPPPDEPWTADGSNWWKILSRFCVSSLVGRIRGRYFKCSNKSSTI